ncbi:MAG: cation-translocating P-type ATPase, partial [Bdellovibrionales bacterium]
MNHFQVSKTKGLSPQLIADMQKKQGYNEMPTAPSRKLSAIFIQQFLSPLIYLLLIAALISYFLGDHKDALVILAVVILNAVIGAFQEGRAEQSLKSLRHLSKIRARVLRGGDWCEIEAREIVVGDIFSITSGDAIPTDGRLLEAVQLSCSEAALTGESLPLIKNTNPLLKESPITEQSNMIFAGAFVTSGRGVAIATTIGQKNEIGKVSALADQAQQPKTQLEKKIQSFGHLIIYISIALFALVIGIGLIDGIALKEIFLVAVSQMVSLVPEGLPVAMTIALAVGVQRMAKEKTVVRKLAAVESLGTTTFICSDKTGTLTKNEMTVQKIFLNQSQEAFIVEGVGYNTHGAIKQISTNRNWSTSQIQENSEFQSLLEAVANCNDSEIKNLDAHNFQILGDPTEAALLILCEKTGQSVAKMRAHHPRWAEIPFDSKNKMMATYHKNTAESLIFIKGAP